MRADAEPTAQSASEIDSSAATWSPVATRSMVQVLVITSPGTSSWVVNRAPPSIVQPSPQTGAPSFSSPLSMPVPVTSSLSLQ